MVRSLLILAAIAMAAVAMPAEPTNEMPEPGNLALLLNEDDFEEYLDQWLAMEQQRFGNVTTQTSRSGCQIRVNGDLGQPQPVYLRNNNYIVPTGSTGIIHLNTGEAVTIACTGSGRTIRHNQISSNVAVANAVCVNNNLMSGAGWLNGNADFGGLTCSAHSYHDAEYTSERCFNNHLVIRVGFWVEGRFYPKFWSCFDPNRLEVLYVWYEQNPPNAVHQTGVDRPSWVGEFPENFKAQATQSRAGGGPGPGKRDGAMARHSTVPLVPAPDRAAPALCDLGFKYPGSFFPGVAINNLYTQVQQKAKIATYVGQDLADKYVTNTQFLARGHLTAKTDMIFATGQRTTFYFINAAPQWQPFNAGNWNWVEQNLRARIGAAGYHTTVWTGTWGVSQLRNQNNQLVDIYLHHDANNNPQLPVPLYFYKVVYDAGRRLGVAFISINNPYYSESEVRALQFCTDRCRGNSAFDWLRWQPDRIDLGYSFCCTIDDFRRVVPHLPSFSVNGLLA